MTQLKLIAREPTKEMKDAVADYMDGGYAYGTFTTMFDAAPNIETEAEKKAREFLAHIDGTANGVPIYGAIDIIRALLRERGKI